MNEKCSTLMNTFEVLNESFYTFEWYVILLLEGFLPTYLPNLDFFSNLELTLIILCIQRYLKIC